MSNAVHSASNVTTSIVSTLILSELMFLGHKKAVFTSQNFKIGCFGSYEILASEQLAIMENLDLVVSCAILDNRQ